VGPRNIGFTWSIYALNVDHRSEQGRAPRGGFHRRDALDGATSSAVARPLQASRYSGRLRGDQFTSSPDIEDEAHVLGALADVGRLDVVDRAEVERFVTGLYVAENGGYGPQPGLGTTPPSTYHAIACLVTLGRLPPPVFG
jgi:geranylgeranyl transferase type-2 subunit beta